MRIIIFGSNGQLGWSLMRCLQRTDFKVRGGDLPDHDICNQDQVRSIIRKEHADLVINASAYTAVDQAENDEINAFEVNQKGPLYLAEACSMGNVPLIHVSTDYVFDGTAADPYCERDPVNPTGVYGASKLAGEQEIRRKLSSHIIIRTAWLYGIHGNNFVKTMIRLGKDRETIKVVDDQYGCPTYAGDLADAIEVVARKIQGKENVEWGTYHYAGDGKTTWYGFAKKILELAQGVVPLKVSNLVPIKTEEYPTPAKRPGYSVLNCEKIKRNFGIHPKPWETSLENTIRSIIKHDTGALRLKR